MLRVFVHCTAVYDCLVILGGRSSAFDRRFLMKQLACFKSTSSVAALAECPLSAFTLRWIIMSFSLDVADSGWLPALPLKSGILSSMLIHCVAAPAFATNVWMHDSGLVLPVISSSAVGWLDAADLIATKPCRVLLACDAGRCTRDAVWVFDWVTLQPTVEAGVACGITLGMRIWRMVVWTAGIIMCCLVSPADLLMPGAVWVVGLQVVTVPSPGAFAVTLVQTGRSMKQRGTATGFLAAWVTTHCSAGALPTPTTGSEMDWVLLAATNLPLPCPRVKADSVAVIPCSPIWAVGLSAADSRWDVAKPVALANAFWDMDCVDACAAIGQSKVEQIGAFDPVVGRLETFPNVAAIIVAILPLVPTTAAALSTGLGSTGSPGLRHTHSAHISTYLTEFLSVYCSA